MPGIERTHLRPGAQHALFMARFCAQAAQALTESFDLHSGRMLADFCADFCVV
jgi:hypothetical protein